MSVRRGTTPGPMGERGIQSETGALLLGPRRPHADSPGHGMTGIYALAPVAFHPTSNEWDTPPPALYRPPRPRVSAVSTAEGGVGTHDRKNAAGSTAPPGRGGRVPPELSRPPTTADPRGAPPPRVTRHPSAPGLGAVTGARSPGGRRPPALVAPPPVDPRRAPQGAAAPGESCQGAGGGGDAGGPGGVLPPRTSPFPPQHTPARARERSPPLRTPR